MCCMNEYAVHSLPKALPDWMLRSYQANVLGWCSDFSPTTQSSNRRNPRDHTSVLGPEGSGASLWEGSQGRKEPWAMTSGARYDGYLEINQTEKKNLTTRLQQKHPMSLHRYLKVYMNTASIDHMSL